MIPLKNKPSRRYWDLEPSTGAQGGTAAELYLYGTIVEDKWEDTDVTPTELINSLQALGAIDELNVHIFSNGGDVFAGNAIYSLLKQRKETVNVYIEGIAASIASVIAMAGDRVFIAKNAMLMVHNPMVFIFGLFNKIDMGKLIADLDRVRDVINVAYTEKTGMSAEEVSALLDANGGDGTFFNAAEAVQMGFADAITPDAKAPKEMAAMIRPNVYASRGREIDLSIYKNPPKLAAVAAEAQTTGAKKMASKKTAVKGKTLKAELVSVECPECGATFDFDDEGATVVICPECGAEFDTAELEAAPIETQAKRKARVKAARPKATRKKLRAEAEEKKKDDEEVVAELVEVQVTCTECGAEFAIDADTTEGEVVVICPECEAELTVALNPEEPEAEPEVETVAMRAMRAERKRLMELDEAAQAFPQYAKAISNFKKSGTSVAAARGWIFKALAAKGGNTAQGGGSYRDAARRDAQVLGRVASPANGNDRSNVVAANFDSLAARRGVKKNGS